MMRVEDQQSKLFYDLCSLVLAILKSPNHQLPLTSSAAPPPVSSSSTSSRRTAMTTSPSILTQVSPAGFASLLLGVSLALMLCGSVTFVIGFILMPWVLGLVMLLYFVGFISNLSCLGRAILCPSSTASSSSSSAASSRITATSPKEISELKLL